jgi:histidine ammonia-lyase
MLALGQGEGMVHLRVHKLHRQRGQIEIASAVRMLMGGGVSAIRDGTAQSRTESLGVAQLLPRMGACLDLLRQAGTTLERAANSVSEDRLVFWQTEEVVAGLDDPSAVSFAADLIAMALREIGTLAERSIAALPGGTDGVERLGAKGNGSTPGAMAASFNAENGERVHSADSGGDQTVSAAPVEGLRRLLPMAGTAALVVAIELLVANRGRGEQPADQRGGIGAVQALLRERIPSSEGENGVPATDLATAAELVRSGELAAAPGFDLPSVIPPCAIFERTKGNGAAPSA